MELSPERLKQMLDADEVQLVDVREPYEYEAGRIAGARHIELAELSQAAETIDRERPVVFYCRGDGRSVMAAEAFGANGYDAHRLEGGLLAWHENGLPLEPKDGEVAERHVAHS
jgi:rhodanese-related sulfurtransferase